MAFHRVFFVGVQTQGSRQSPLTRWYLRKPADSRNQELSDATNVPQSHAVAGRTCREDELNPILRNWAGTATPVGIPLGCRGPQKATLQQNGVFIQRTHCGLTVHARATTLRDTFSSLAAMVCD